METLRIQIAIVCFSYCKINQISKGVVGVRTFEYEDERKMVVALATGEIISMQFNTVRFNLSSFSNSI